MISIATGLNANSAKRICPACRAGEEILGDDPVWPVGRTCPRCGHAAPMSDGVPLFAPALADTVSGFDPHDFQKLAEIESGHFWFEPRNRLLATLVERHFPRAERILEIGCGNGFVLAELGRRYPAARLVGAELHPSGLVAARHRLGERAELVQMDARDIVAEATFDVIGAFDVIEHIREDETVLQSIHQALRNGGGVVIAVPQHPWLWSGADEVAHHERRYRRGELEEKLAANGFDIEFSGSYCSALLPLMMVSRWFERLSRRSGEAATASEVEARPSPVINSALKATLNAEVSATLAGARFPAGGSQVVVARRRGEGAPAAS